MLKRSAFRRPEWTPQPRTPLVLVDRPVAVAPVRREPVFNPQPKLDLCRSEPYRRLIAAMPCAHCGRAGPSQAAHSDSGADGKGMGMKSDDRTCYPSCATSPGRLGCHDLIGTARMFSKPLREALEEGYAKKARARVLADGNWPAGLPLWKE